MKGAGSNPHSLSFCPVPVVVQRTYNGKPEREEFARNATEAQRKETTRLRGQSTERARITLPRDVAMSSEASPRNTLGDSSLGAQRTANG